MAPVLEGLAPGIAAGVLARAALALESRAQNPAAEPIVQDELALRERVIEDARATLGLRPDDFSGSALALISERLDSTADELVSKPDIEGATLRLAERGELSSDRFDIRVADTMREVYGRYFEREVKRIEETVHAPDIEQHFGAPAQEGDPALISLFLRHYSDRFPYRSFYLLVAGQRDKLVMHVHQAWRLYPAVMHVSPSPDLVGMLRNFADEFGSEVRVGDIKGKMIVNASLPAGTKSVTAELPQGKPNAKPERHMTSLFTQKDPLTQELRGSLIVSINMTMYKKLLERMRWEEPPLSRWWLGSAPLTKSE
jgi:hypothetical protein